MCRLNVLIPIKLLAKYLRPTKLSIYFLFLYALEEKIALLLAKKILAIDIEIAFNLKINLALF